MRQIALSGKQGRGKFAKVDDENFKYLNQFKWYLSDGGYAIRRPYIKGSGRRNQKCQTIRMHRIIINAPDNMKIDHWNNDRLDNQKSNLRMATNLQNSQK